MSYIPRRLDLKTLLSKKSFFLFGPRSTGKSTLITHQLGDQANLINLLKTDHFLRLSAHPEKLEDLVRASIKENQVTVIDEIQKIPILLNEVHRLIEEHHALFLLTGSSARKLKTQGINLLAGRAWQANLFPLSYTEISDFDLQRFLRYGGLPPVYLSNEPEEELYAYVNTYLKEEIQAEGEVRRLQPFTRFLEVASLTSGEILNFTKIGSDAQVAPSTIREYYQLLEDTLIGFQLFPWTASKKRKAVQTAKFYFFDVGVVHTLNGTKALDKNSDLFGKAFEHFIGMELQAYLSYTRIKKTISFWRTQHGFEVDFLIGSEIAIEVKSSERVTSSDYKGLRALQEEGKFKNFYLISQDTFETLTQDNIHTFHWQTFLKKLWAGEII